MRFCDNCGRAMVRDTTAGAVVYRCPCGAEEKGAPADARVGGATLEARETTALYGPLIRSAPSDRTTQLVRRNCPRCGLDHMCQIRIGDAEIVVYKCKCGHEEGADALRGKETPHK